MAGSIATGIAATATSARHVTPTCGPCVRQRAACLLLVLAGRCDCAACCVQLASGSTVTGAASAGAQPLPLLLATAGMPITTAGFTAAAAAMGCSAAAAIGCSAAAAPIACRRCALIAAICGAACCCLAAAIARFTAAAAIARLAGRYGLLCVSSRIHFCKGFEGVQDGPVAGAAAAGVRRGARALQHSSCVDDSARLGAQS